MKLKRDQQAFRWPQKREADEEGQREENQDVHPERRLIEQLHPDGCAEHEQSADEAPENGRPVARIGEPIIETTVLAARRQCQEARKERGLPAAGTVALKAGQNGET